MAETSDHRALARVLSDRSDDELAALFAERGVSPTAPWRDFFDAAEGMLEPAAIARALAALPAEAAEALADAVAASAPLAPGARTALTARALATEEGEVFSAVAAAVRALPSPQRAAAPAAPALDPADEAAAAERAFSSAASLADVLLSALRAPLTRIGTGSLGAAERKRLLEAGAVAEPGDADLLVGLADTVGLLAAREREWLITRAGRDWLRTGTIARWRHVARQLREHMPAGLRSAEGGWIPMSRWRQAYPFDPAWPAIAAQWEARALAWGLVAAGGAVPSWSAPLARGEDVDIAALERVLPPEVDRVYLQNDLTAIAPGPLAPQLDLRLRTMTVRESRAQASTYRFTADSIAAAITAGESAESLRAFLSELSLTGLPQPLEYVIERTASRHGQIRVGRDGASGLTLVTSEEEAALRTVAVDQTLRALGLVGDGDALVTRASEETVFWALADARYPVVAVDADGAPRRLERGRIAPEVAPTAPLERYASLVSRLRTSEGGDGDGDAAWLERELDHAVRARADIEVVVDLPDGSTRAFRLEATGLGGGRLRGRDRVADVERTLPLSRIVSVRPIA